MNGTMRGSPLYSWYDRSVSSSGMPGQKSGPPSRLVRSDVGPNMPSGCCVARMPSIHFLVRSSTRLSPVT